MRAHVRIGVVALTLTAAAMLTLAQGGASRAEASGSFVVQVLRFVDHTRTVPLPNGQLVARPVTTIVRYPMAKGAHPLIVFGHGFALTPHTYAALLSSWTRAGYVVAAPIFPRGNTNAPGGPTESDLPNQPADISLVITRLLALNARPGRLHRRIDVHRIAVAGQSDGGVTALAAADDNRYRDARIRAAVILSGAEPAGMSGFARNAPPLLAVQGTADPINAPANTETFYSIAPRPKFLLLLLGGSHLPPYTSDDRQLHIVERVTIAFLNHYLKGGPLRPLTALSAIPGLSTLTSDP
jgi:predicted dienelactone hydrolase